MNRRVKDLVVFAEAGRACAQRGGEVASSCAVDRRVGCVRVAKVTQSARAATMVLNNGVNVLSDATQRGVSENVGCQSYVVQYNALTGWQGQECMLHRGWESRSKLSFQAQARHAGTVSYVSYFTLQAVGLP